MLQDTIPYRNIPIIILKYSCFCIINNLELLFAGPTINRVLNENSQELFREIKPDLIVVIVEIVTSIANAILSNMPFLVDYLENA